MSGPVVGVLGGVAPRRSLEAGTPCPPCPPPPPCPPVPLVVRPLLADATIINPASLGTWSQVAPGDFEFDATGFAAASAQTTPANGATLVWPITKPTGGAAAFADCNDLHIPIVQYDGVPGSATNYAIVAGICNAAGTEFAYVGPNHATLNQACFMISGGSFSTNTGIGVAMLGKINLWRLATTGNVTLASVLGERMASLAAMDETTFTAFGHTTSPNRNSGTTISGLRYFLSFLPRGTLASKPANPRVRVAFRPIPVALETP